MFFTIGETTGQMRERGQKGELVEEADSWHFHPQCSEDGK